MISPQEALQQLTADDLFKVWKKGHSKSFLTHFFIQLNSEGIFKTNWEIGFFDPENEKITVFSLLQTGKIEIKPADDVFKKEETSLEELSLKEVKTNLEQALSLFKENLPIYFPKEKVGDGFLILQTLNGKTFWNFTFISQSLKFLNLKINAQTGTADSHEEVSLMESKGQKR